MNRIIKFRLYDLETGYLSLGLTIKEISEIRKNPVGIEQFSLVVGWNKLIFLQFSGVFDMNQEEIYEDYIIKYKLFSWQTGFKTGKVIFKDGAFMVTMAKDDLVGRRERTYILSGLDSIEIVGFEYKHLLEAAD